MEQKSKRAMSKMENAILSHACDVLRTLGSAEVANDARPDLRQRVALVDGQRHLEEAAARLRVHQIQRHRRLQWKRHLTARQQEWFARELWLSVSLKCLRSRKQQLSNSAKRHLFCSQRNRTSVL